MKKQGTKIFEKTEQNTRSLASVPEMENTYCVPRGGGLHSVSAATAEIDTRRVFLNVEVWSSLSFYFHQSAGGLQQQKMLQQ